MSKTDEIFVPVQDKRQFDMWSLPISLSPRHLKGQ